MGAQAYFNQIYFTSDSCADATFFLRTSRGTASSEYLRDGTSDAVAHVYPYKLSQPPGSEELYGNTIHAVASLLHEIAQRAAASEYLRDGIIDAVAETFPYKLSQPPGSEELYGNTIHAVAHLPRKRGTAAFIF